MKDIINILFVSSPASVIYNRPPFLTDFQLLKCQKRQLEVKGDGKATLVDEDDDRVRYDSFVFFSLRLYATGFFWQTKNQYEPLIGNIQARGAAATLNSLEQNHKC